MNKKSDDEINILFARIEGKLTCIRDMMLKKHHRDLWYSFITEVILLLDNLIEESQK